MRISHPYQNHTAVLTSKHQKLHLIEPSFHDLIGLQIVETALDTDQFGTFSAEIERTLSPIEAALAKARMGMRELGISIGIASEGSIGPDPAAPFIISDIEHMVLVDDQAGIVVSESFRSFEIITANINFLPGQDLEDFLRRADFPRHQLIVKAEKAQPNHCVKGIDSRRELEVAIKSCSRKSPTGVVVIQSDLRADRSPSRQRNIAHAAKLLATRISQLCPDCQAPGWGRVEYERGLLCESCNGYVALAIRAEVNGCVRCDHRVIGKQLTRRASPSICNWCNP